MNINPHYQGDSLEMIIPIRRPDGTPYPLAGATLTYQAWAKHYCTGEPAIEQTIGDGISIVDQAQSRVLIKIAAGRIDKPVIWTHKLLIRIPATGFEQTIMQGEIRVLASKPPCA